MGVGTFLMMGVLANLTPHLGSSGLGYAFVRRGEPPVCEGTGTADRATGRPVTGDTIFPVASVSKLFLGLALDHLFKERGIPLSTPLEELAPGLGPRNPWAASDPVRVSHLVEHKTGLQELIAGAKHTADDPYKSVRALVDAARPHMHVRWRPGTVMTYSNMNYLIAMALVETLAGEPFDRYTARTILAPSGMRDATFRLREVDRTRFAYGYRTNDPTPVEPYEGFYRPAAGLLATPCDLARFLAAYLDGRFGNGLPPGATVRTVRGRRLVGHNGMIDGASASLFIDQERGLGYALLVNAHPLPESPSLSRLRDAILAHFDPTYVPPARAPPPALEPGYYRLVNPRFALLSPLAQLAGGVWISEGEELPTGARAYERVVPWSESLQIGAFAIAFLGLLAALGRVRQRGPVYWLCAASVASLAATVACFATIDTTFVATTLNARTAGAFAASLAFAACAFAAPLVWLGRSPRSRLLGVAAWGLAYVAAQLVRGGLVGVRPWEWA